MKEITLVAGIVLAVGFSMQATPITIADWTFETSKPTTAGPIAPEIGAGSMTGHHAGAAVYSHLQGNGSPVSYSSTVWAVGDYYQVEVSTLTLADIQLSYDQTGSTSGPKFFRLEYSTDGTTFQNIGSEYTVLSTTWSSATHSTVNSYSDDLSSIAALDNQSEIYLRFADASTTSASGGTVSANGADRMDNIDITASPAPDQTSTLALLSCASAVGLGFFRRIKK